VKKTILALVLGGLFLAACGTGNPVKQFNKGDEIAFYDFTSPASFEEGTYADGTARLQVTNGVYNIVLTTGDNTIYYGQWGNSLSDVLIDVDTQQNTEDQNTAYGVICRARGRVGQPISLDNADESTPAPTNAAASSESAAEATKEATAEVTREATSEATAEATAEATTELSSTISNNGDGYLFLVEGTGRFAIMRARGRTVTPLVNWTSNSAIRTGAAQNHIRVICTGNYLAMLVNDQFMGDASDDTYKDGQVGLAAVAASRTGVFVTFDNLALVKPELASS
jgi:hypothetical protein